MKKLLFLLLVIGLVLSSSTSFAAWGNYICTVTEVRMTNYGPKVFLERVSDSTTYECYFNADFNEKLAIALTAISSGYNVMANFNDSGITPIIYTFGIQP